MRFVPKVVLKSMTVAIIAYSGLSFAGASDMEALKDKISSIDSFTSPFLQVVTNQSDEEVHRAKGSISITSNNTFRWETNTPDESLLIADGTTVWNIDPFVEQVTLLSQSDVLKDNPFMLLTTDNNETWEAYNVEQDKLHPNTFTITPKQSSNVTSLTMTFNKGMLSSLSILDTQLQKSDITFTFPSNETVDPSAFQFTVPSGYAVDDQRNLAVP